MARYPNGEWPESALITLARGVDGDGEWKHQLTPGTLAKWNKLRALAHKRTGRWLALSTGYSGYRPLEAQRRYWRIYGYGAAYPRTSSHGGVWEGRDTLALDVGNWAWVYDRFANPRAEFYADVRAAGMEPGLIHPSRGNNYPDEPWHIIDFEPFRVPVTPDPPTPKLYPEEDEMLFLKIDKKYLVSVGVGVLKHWGPADSQQVREHVKNISRQDDAWQDVDFPQFTATLATYGCDPHIWDIRKFNGKDDFCVLNPLDGSVKQGNTWTAVNAMRAEQSKIAAQNKTAK